MEYLKPLSGNNPEQVLPLAVKQFSEQEIPFKNYDDFYCMIIYLSEGSCSLLMDNKKTSSNILINAPSVLRISLNQKIELYNSFSVKGWAVAFTPNVINSSFNINTYWEDLKELNYTTGHDFFLIESFLEQNIFTKVLRNLSLIENERISTLFNSIKDQIENDDPYWRCRTRSYLMEMLSILQWDSMKHMDTPYSIDSDKPWLSRALSFIHSYFQTTLTLEKICSTIGINRTTLTTSFQEKFGMTIKKYIKNYRMKMAVQFLKETGLTIGEISERVGISSQSKFSASFKEYTNCTPLEYRKLY